MKMLVRRVSKSVGINPVARAVAKAMLGKAITDYRIAFYMLDEGERCAGLTDSVSLPLRALMLTMGSEINSPDFRKLKSAEMVLEQLWLRGTWRKDDTVTLDNAFQILLERWPKIDPITANNAIRFAQKELVG